MDTREDAEWPDIHDGGDNVDEPMDIHDGGDNLDEPMPMPE